MYGSGSPIVRQCSGCARRSIRLTRQKILFICMFIIGAIAAFVYLGDPPPPEINYRKSGLWKRILVEVVPQGTANLETFLFDYVYRPETLLLGVDHSPLNQSQATRGAGLEYVATNNEYRPSLNDYSALENVLFTPVRATPALGCPIDPKGSAPPAPFYFRYPTRLNAMSFNNDQYFRKIEQRKRRFGYPSFNCDNRNFASIDDSDPSRLQILIRCNANVQYTFDHHSLLGPIDFPSDKGVDRKFKTTKESIIIWPESEEYIEIHCNTTRQYFSRVVEKPAIYKKKQVAFQSNVEKHHLSKDSPNLVVLIVDTVSRPQHTQLFPETLKFIKRISQGDSELNDDEEIGSNYRTERRNEEKNANDRTSDENNVFANVNIDLESDFDTKLEREITKRYRSFSFNRLNSPDHSLTMANLTPLFSGYKWNSRRLAADVSATYIYSLNYTNIYEVGPTQPPLIWDYLGRAGYVTSFSAMNNNMMGARTFDHLTPAILSWSGDLPSHYGKMIYNYDPKTGPCYAGRRSFIHPLEYTIEFLQSNTYHGLPKFSFVHLLENHRPDDYGMVSADVPIKNFLINLMNTPNTIVAFGSDHGNRDFDRRVPFLHLFVPRNRLSPRHERALYINQVRDFSHYDTHETLKHLIVASNRDIDNEKFEKNDIAGNFEYQEDQRVSNIFGAKVTPPKVQSLLRLVPRRTCDEMGVAMFSCFCNEVIIMSTSHPILRKLAEHSLALENSLLPLGCEQVSLRRVGWGRVSFPPSSSLSSESLDSLVIDNSNSPHPPSNRPSESQAVTYDAYVETQFYVNEGYRGYAVFYASALIKDNKFHEILLRQITTYSDYDSCRPKGASRNMCICNHGVPESWSDWLGRFLVLPQW